MSSGEILEECALSKELGMEAVIIDDGWQIDRPSGWYDCCGDWEPAVSKVKDFAVLSDQIHALGMKVILWFSVPFMGIRAKRYEEFKDMLLDQTENGNLYFSMDPRYPQVREYLIETYTHALKDWHLDGLKLDFIDHFVLKGKSMEPDPRRDYTSLEEAVDRLMIDVSLALRRINPEVLIEFRQTYVGPAIRKYGNMLRVKDCPNDGLKNRQEIVNLRLTSGRTAVHSDMLIWNRQERTEIAALQVIATLFGVPQISLKIKDMTEEHKRMLKFYLGFWRENRDVLLDGKLTATNPESYYSKITFALGDRAVTVCYDDRIAALESAYTTVINASGTGSLILQAGAGKAYCVLNCLGEKIGEGVLQSKLEEISVPVGGMIVAG